MQPSRNRTKARRSRGRVASAFRLAGAVLVGSPLGCIPDPNVDPCRGMPLECYDGGSSVDADSHVVMDAEAGLFGDGAAADSAPDVDGDSASAEPGDAALDAEPDASTADAGPAPDAGPPQALALVGDLGVHDPTIIEADGEYIIFSTGRGVSVKRSPDLLTWANAGRVFESNPAWIATEVPGASDLWAPEIAAYGGKYHLYYSASTFGSRDSCIGHATATDLSSLNFVDQGPVICSEESDDFNAIDPAFVIDDAGTAWLGFGSFWSGIKLIRLDADGQRDGTAFHSLASRDGVEAIEAPYFVRRGGDYYLFVSFDLCCRGIASTYRIMVGRSDSVTGPYMDADGTPMLSSGGGNAVVLGNQRWRGPGHNSVLDTDAGQYLVYHAYDADHGGAATLRILPLVWDSAGWPIPGGP